ncbi:ABC transporter permease [Fodinicurvata fenggangensis]|uniref:ABC transporter permease n=1 Tax=Fodinicurvata fenggangensis TaxID=1121830 RepID=UPI0009DCD0D6|nr:ABC transporter permease [Fodinicurvata fenggangensis]
MSRSNSSLLAPHSENEARRPPRQHRKLPPGPLDYSRRWWMRLPLFLVFFFLYAPMVVLVAFSFNDSKRNIVWQGFTTDYYVAAFNNTELMEAFINSLTIALMNTVVATLLGTLVAIALWRFRFRGRAAFEGLTALPIVIPEICMGVAMMAFFARIGWPTDLPWPVNLVKITIAHIAFSFPFVAIVVRARLSNFDRALEEASTDLGATQWQNMRYILLPHLKPAVIAGALIAFTLSLDDFVITFFTAGPNTITLPVKIFSMVRFSVTPEVNAASTILILITIVTATLAMWLQGRSLMHPLRSRQTE